jgi:hypothetical protein
VNGFQSPNWTETPNDLFDEYMALMGNAELRVVLAIVRQTRGWHRTSTKFSISKLRRMTGLSHNGVTSGAKQAEARGLITRTNPSDITSAEWELVINDTPSASAPPQPVNDTPSASEGQVGLKKEEKNEERNDLEDVFFRQVMVATGIMAVQTDIPVMLEWYKKGTTVDDIKAAISWRVDNEKKAVKTISQLAGGVEVSRQRRIQGFSNKPAQTTVNGITVIQARD